MVLNVYKSVKPGEQRSFVIYITNVSLAIELLTYILITILCLRAIWVTSSATFGNLLARDDEVYSEVDRALAVQIFSNTVFFRKKVYQYALILTVITSVAFIFSFAIKFTMYNI